MNLRSFIFAGQPQLEACRVRDAAHVTRGAIGQHVRMIQTALMHLDDASIDPGERQRSHYGVSTAHAVLAYKKKRNIIATNRQSGADDIVGRMTIAALDAEMLASERMAPRPRRKPHGPGTTQRSATEIAARNVVEQVIRSALTKLR